LDELDIADESAYGHGSDLLVAASSYRRDPRDVHLPDNFGCFITSMTPGGTPSVSSRKA
jgi:hypothetical protein